MDPKTLNPLALAYVGDAVYEQFVRERLVRGGRGGGHADLLHKAGVKYVCAGAQAAALHALEGELTEYEAGLVRRARNHKIATKPKNADPMTYKNATAFEALLGYLHLTGDAERTLWVMQKAAEFIEQENQTEGE